MPNERQYAAHVDYWRDRAQAAERRVAELEAAPDLREPLRELAGYVRAHLAGQDADPELKWALEQADEALAEDGGGA